MNRRDFLRLAGASTAGATGTILISCTSAASLLNDGKAIITEADVKRGKLITPQEMIEEQVNISQLGDNLAKLLLRSGDGITVTPMEGNPDFFQVFGAVPDEGAPWFTQHAKYKLVCGGKQSNSIIGLRNKR